MNNENYLALLIHMGDPRSKRSNEIIDLPACFPFKDRDKIYANRIHTILIINHLCLPFNGLQLTHIVFKCTKSSKYFLIYSRTLDWFFSLLFRSWNFSPKMMMIKILMLNSVKGQKKKFFFFDCSFANL